jgi:hypothetical protein
MTRWSSEGRKDGQVIGPYFQIVNSLGKISTLVDVCEQPNQTSVYLHLKLIALSAAPYRVVSSEILM